MIELKVIQDKIEQKADFINFDFLFDQKSDILYKVL